MSRMNEKQKLLAIAGVSLALTLGAGGGVYWAKGLVEQENEAIAAKKVQIQAAQKKIDKIKGVEEEVIILRENLDEYVQILPNNSEVEDFVQALYKFSSQTGIITDSVKPGRTKGKGKGGFSQVTYEYKLEATLWQALEFMNLIESYDRFIKVTKFDLKSRGDRGASDEEKVKGDVRHEIAMSFETYVYEAGGGKDKVLIPNYAFKRDALKERIFESLQAIQIENYEYRGQLSRRDIFTDPRQAADGVGPDGIAVSEQEKIIVRFREEVDRLTQVFERLSGNSVTVMERFQLQRMLEDGLAEITAGTEKVNEQGVISFRPYEVRWNKDVEQPVADLRHDFEQFLEGTKGERDDALDMATLEELHASMVRFVRTGSLDEAIRRFEDVEEKLRVPSDDSRFQKVLDVTTLYKKSIVAKEFQRLHLDIQGVVVRGNGRSGVLLNNQVLEEGDYVGPDCFIKQVMSEQVAFVYKGLTLIKTF